MTSGVAGTNRISMKVEKAAKQLEALGNPTRLQLYRALIRVGDEGVPVGHLQEKLHIAGLDAVSSSAPLDPNGSSDTGASGDDFDLPC